MNSLPTTLSLPDGAAEQDLVRRVRQLLRSQQPALLSRIDLAAEGRTVTLEETLRSFYERQHAIACFRRVAGVGHFVDLLTVAKSPTRCREPQELQEVLV